MTEDQMKHMAQRFLNWPLPENFAPDGGVSFEPVGNPGTEWEYRNTPTGTNLLDYTQALEMVRHIVGGLTAGAEVERLISRVQEGKTTIQAYKMLLKDSEAERDRQYDENVERIAMQAKVEAERDALIAGAYEAAAKSIEGECEKCGGNGWLWGPELDEYECPHPGATDDTRYSCDGQAHKQTEAIRALTPADAHAALDRVREEGRREGVAEAEIVDELRAALRRVDGDEAHRILPNIWQHLQALNAARAALIRKDTE